MYIIFKILCFSWMVAGKFADSIVKIKPVSDKSGMLTLSLIKVNLSKKSLCYYVLFQFTKCEIESWLKRETK